MTEEKNGVKNGEATTEMAPQEDGTKVPLTNDAGPEVKFTSGAENYPPNGEAKIDLGNAPTFSGLSKEDLMKYSDDPFWVRLRWFLFILFWGGWLAMLVVAIVIIIQAPRCAPKETLLWVQESAIVKYDPSAPIDVDGDGETTSADMTKMADELGVTTVYLNKLISSIDFTEINEAYNNDDILGMLKAAKDKGFHVVTDFVDLDVVAENVWFKDANMSDFFEPGSSKLNLKNEGLREKLVEVLSGWVNKGVQGFIISASMTPDLEEAKQFLDKVLKRDVDGAVVSGITDMKDQLVSGFNAEMYRSFLGEHENDWSYFKYNPQVAESSINELVDLVTMTLFLVRGTPVLDGFDPAYMGTEKNLISQLSELRGKESVQIGDMIYVNNTAESVLAFARVAKGTPGYAVAINMDDTNSTLVDFTSIEGVKGKGDVHLLAPVNNATESAVTSSEKRDLDSVILGPLEGIILQFVPSF